MKLMTEQIKKVIPNTYGQEAVPTLEQVAHVHYFVDNCDRYATEYNQKTGEMFGRASIGFGYEMGYFSLLDLESVRGRLGTKVERDLYFKPTKIRDLHLSQQA